MQKIATSNRYDYYIGEDAKGRFYNIVPAGSAAPNGGYDHRWICGVKKVPNLFITTGNTN